MGVQMFKELFDGKFDGVSAPTMIPKGGLSGGLNVRKVSAAGGWKPRKGSERWNATAVVASTDIDSLHRYVNPLGNETDAFHFFAQCNSLLYELLADPPGTYASATSLGVTVGTTPGFSCVVGEDWFYADGSGTPIRYGGGEPLCSGFIAYDDSEAAYVDFTRVVTDGRTDTGGLILLAAADDLYICCPEFCEGVYLTLGTTKNTTSSITLAVKAWQSGSWAAVSSLSDGTDTGSTTPFGQSGAITWDRDTSDEMKIIGGIEGYWYQLTWDVALSGNVNVTKCTARRDATTITNKWNGIWNWVTGCRFYDASLTDYIEVLGKVTNTSTSQYVDLDEATVSDKLYIKTPEPASAFGLAIPQGNANTAASTLSIKYWDGDSWTACADVVDTTKNGDGDTLAQTGTLTFDGSADSPVRRTFKGDPIPGYWYELTIVTNTLTADTRLFMVTYASFPEALPTYDGCVEFKGRLFIWGDPEYPNRLRYSAFDRSDCFSGIDSGYTDPFGGKDKVLCAIPFYNELLVFKESTVWLLEGYSPQTFGTLRVASTVGLASPKSAHVAEVGSPTMHSDEPLSIAIWQDIDGIYVLDGRKPRKASGAINNYFDTEHAEAIAAASLRNRQAFTDRLRNEYHFLLPAGELVYNYETDEWYPPWEREVDLITGLTFRGDTNRIVSYGGSANGFLFQLEEGTIDDSEAGTDTAIEHSVKTRAIGATEGTGTTLRFTMKRAWAEFKAQTAGTPTTNFFKNMASSGTAITTPSAMSMIATGYSLATPHVDISTQNCSCFQLEFALDTVNQEMEIYSITYELEAVGEIGV